MQNTSQEYNDIIVDLNHWFEYKVSINGVSYGEDVLRSMSTKHEMFSEEPEIGKAIAGEIDITMNLQNVNIPPMSEIIPYVRACRDGEQSEWLQQGVFYIDTREQTKGGAPKLIIHGFDAMLKAEQPFTSNTITGNSTDTDMVDAIAAIMGVDVDVRTYGLMTSSYTIPLPTGYSCREILGYIASMYLGCFIINEVGELRLVAINELPPETNILIDEGGNPIYFGDHVYILV